MIDADDGEPVGKPIGPDKVVERRHDEGLGQIATGAEDRHGGGVGPASGKTPCNSCRGVRRNCCHCCSPGVVGSLTSLSCEETGKRLPSRFMLAFWGDLTTRSTTTSFTSLVFRRPDRI